MRHRAIDVGLSL